jgi:hypothetical protein
MAQYLLAVHSTEADHDRDSGGGYGSSEAMTAAFEATDRLNRELQAEGHWVFGGGLQAPSRASVVDGRGDSPVVTDGPYLESKEHIGGFWVIEAPDLDTARAIAARASHACRALVEVRPFEEEPVDPVDPR